MEITPEIIERLKLLNEKYASSGQDLLSYLDGLLYSDYLKYWDYIELDTLLSLQKPRTNFPDEEIFIIYHQITELYFKLVRKEFGNIHNNKDLTGDYFINRIKRCCRYFEALVSSFEIMVDGMDNKEFMKFRMALLPASGFQSAQYRMIEIESTKLNNLVALPKRDSFKSSTDIEEMYENIYWKQGAQDTITKSKTLTLLQFEERYDKELIELATFSQNSNIWTAYKRLSIDEQKRDDIRENMRLFDLLINVNWPLAHYKSAVRYLHTKGGDVNATGGTNWQKYLPPRMQKRIFFPELWSKDEMDNWGKNWVEDTLGKL